ncbi:J domain-containing protein [Helicobacter sp. 16-1353]|uniref:J domain-containing protein n=1 Tax=Helicobacter sp. 16-1353 TaxID=2004996 RepID=UPI00215D2AF6|nr:J domain-containing protein [Helicobacter sp. 16-1353]
MRVETFNRFVQISIEEQNPMLFKILRYATKYFQNQYHLSSSILILDDGERFKKDYLINWAYYSAMQEQHSIEDSTLKKLEHILESSYLPIRIKITSSNSLLECVRISFRLLGVNRAVLIFDRPNHIAKRYINAMLSQIIISSDLSHIYLDSTTPDFWYYLMKIIGNKIIHNVRLEFDYDSFKLQQFNQKGFKSSYLTLKEQKLHKAYFVLGCNHNDSFFCIKSRYLELIKEYHPDKVFGKDESIIKFYNLKFIELKEAFDIIKASFENI